MYVTGGIGSSGFLERFTTDYDLPNDCNYSETCASIGMAMFGLRMANITRESQYADIAELQLYNTILAGAALDGQSFFYVNPLEVCPQNCMPHTSRGSALPAALRMLRVPWHLLGNIYTASVNGKSTCICIYQMKPIFHLTAGISLS